VVPSAAGTPQAVVAEGSTNKTLPNQSAAESKANAKTDPMGSYEFDQYQGRLYRIFEGTVLEGVVTNHIDGGFSGPILVMLTTDYYSHDHQQLLMPQGTRLIGTVQSVGNAQQRKMFVTFHRAVCPDGFSLDFDKYIGLDPIGTTGLATKVDHGYLMAFGAAAAIGGLGGLTQIGNNGSTLSASTEIRNGISEQSAAEGEQVLNHFLNRLPVITLKEGSRARVYIGRDILIPSYAEHRMDPTL
jgi:type IV secretion system protein VirB10